MPTYQEMLRDPRWIECRAKVIERDEHTCQTCWSSDTTLSVHHTYYMTDAKPWEYPIYDDWPHALETVCADCHPYRDAMRRNAKELVWWSNRIKENPKLKQWLEQHPFGAFPEQFWTDYIYRMYSRSTPSSVDTGQKI